MATVNLHLCWFNNKINVAHKLRWRHAEYSPKFPASISCIFLRQSILRTIFNWKPLALSFSFIWKYTIEYLSFEYHLSWYWVLPMLLQSDLNYCCLLTEHCNSLSCGCLQELALEFHHHEELNISLWSVCVLTLPVEPDTVTYPNI